MSLLLPHYNHRFLTLAGSRVHWAQPQIPAVTVMTVLACFVCMMAALSCGQGFQTIPNVALPPHTQRGMVITGASSSAAGPSITEVKVIEVLGSSLLPGRRRETLPVDYVRHFPLWVVNSEQVVHVPGVGGVGDEVDAWCDPLGYSELWLSHGLSRPRGRVGVGFVLKDGAPRYLFPTLDTTLLKADVSAGGFTPWRNRGFNSIPFARSWLPVDVETIRQAKLWAFITDPTKKPSSVGGEPAWTPIVEGVSLQQLNVFESLSEVIADPPDGFGAGFQTMIVNAEGGSGKEWDVPGPGGRIRMYVGPENPHSMGGDVEAATLDVMCLEVASGAASQWLPEVYRKLYGD